MDIVNEWHMEQETRVHGAAAQIPHRAVKARPIAPVGWAFGLMVTARDMARLTEGI